MGEVGWGGDGIITTSTTLKIVKIKQIKDRGGCNIYLSYQYKNYNLQYFA